MSKLYLVQITYEAYVLADGWRDAQDHEHEIVHTEVPEVHVGEVHSEDVKIWDDASLVYGASRDTPLGEVWPAKVEKP